MTLRGTSNKTDASNSSAGSSSSNNPTTGGERHGSTESSGAESFRSDDTVRGPFANIRGMPKLNTNKKLQYVYFIFVTWTGWRSSGAFLQKCGMPWTPSW